MPHPLDRAEPPFWQLPVTALMEQLGSSPEGLRSAEAALRLAHFGPNLIHAERKRALILQFLAKFRNPWSSSPHCQRFSQPSRETPRASSSSAP